jgi:hypothetical protein
MMAVVNAQILPDANSEIEHRFILLEIVFTGIFIVELVINMFGSWCDSINMFGSLTCLGHGVTPLTCLGH